MRQSQESRHQSLRSFFIWAQKADLELGWAKPCQQLSCWMAGCPVLNHLILVSYYFRETTPGM
jgi:hypothetical protein